jgi:putative addiction module killer protein
LLYRWRARDYQDRDGRFEPAARAIERLAQGHMGDSKAVGDGVMELRVHFGPGYRVYITQRGATLIVLLCGGEKRSQERDIKRARAMALKLET